MSCIKIGVDHENILMKYKVVKEASSRRSTEDGKDLVGTN